MTNRIPSPLFFRLFLRLVLRRFSRFLAATAGPGLASAVTAAVVATGAASICPVSAHAGPAEDKGLEIARKADKANEGFATEKGTMTLELINAHGDVTKRKMRFEVVEGKEDGDKSLSVFDWPADVKGTKLLTFTHKKGDDDQWLFLPAVKRVKRIASSNRSGSFMGSEFAFEDLASQEVEKYTYKHLDDVKHDGRDCWRLERVPLEKNSGYKRQVVWMDKEYLAPVKIEFYDRKNELLKVSVFVGYKKQGKFWRFERISVENVQTRKKSVLAWENRELGAKVDASRFDSAALED